MIPRLSNQQYVLFLSGAGSLALGAAGIAGLFFGIPFLADLGLGTKLISLYAALVWCLFGIILIYCSVRSPSGKIRAVFAALTALTATISALDFPLSLQGTHLFAETLINSSAAPFMAATLAPVSPGGEFLRICGAVGLFQLVYTGDMTGSPKKERDFLGLTGLFCAAVGLVFTLSYVYDMPLVPDTGVVPIAFPSALAGIFIGCGLLAAAGETAVPRVYFTGPSTRARLLRYFVPLTVLIVIVQSILRSWLGPLFGINMALEIAISIVVFCFVTVIIVSLVATGVGEQIDREREQRETAEKELQKEHEDLNAAYEQLTATEEELRANYDELAMSRGNLQESNLRMSEAQRMARLGFWTWDIRTGKVEWSEELFRIFGLNPSVFTPQIDSILALSPWPEEQQRGRELIQRATKSHGPGTYEQRFLRPDGSLGYYYSTFEGRYDPEGNLTSVVGTVLDVTGRKKAEEAIRESEAKLAVALASMADAVFISYADGNFLEFNDAFATFHRFKDKAKCATTLKEYPEFLEVYMADGTLAPLEMWVVSRALRGETGTNVEYSLKRKDTQESWTGSYSFAPLRDEQGRITGSVVSARDITAQKQAEKELREKHAELNAAYEQLTATEEELRQNYDELEKSGQKLRASEQRLRQFYESGLFGVIFWTTKGGITDANDKFLEMTGYSREDLAAGRIDWVSMTPPEYRDLDERSLAELKETGVNHEPLEKEYYRKDGSRLPILIAGAMLDDHFFEGVAFVLDISVRKSTEAALRASEERYKSLFENMQEGLAYCRMIYDENGGPADFVYLAVNKAFEQIIGEGTVIGKPVTEVFPGIREAFPQLFEIYGRVARTGSPEAFEIYFTPSKKWLHLSVYSPGKEEFVAVFSDITARKSAEAEKERLAGQRQLALNAANLGWWHYDPVSKISTWDERYAEIFGLSEHTLPNEENLRLLDPADLPRVRAAAGAALDPAGPRPYSIEYRVHRPDGEVRWVRANGVAAFEGTGASRHATSFVGTVEDITRRRRAEQQRESLIKDLEEKNAELERFTYTVSHDLKSPLITIRGFAGLLEEDLKSNEADKIARDLDRIMAATGKMETLLTDLLNLSRIGRIVNPPEAVSFTRIAQEAVELLDSAIRNRGIAIKIDPGMPEVNVDRVRVREALTNLIENAIKFMGDRPGPEICIGLKEGGDGPVFFVRDNGIGIEAKYHERIFTLFEKLDARKDGAGAGLAIVKRIIEVHGGKIWVESAGPGSGCTFFFTLPVPDHGMTGTHNTEKKGV